jgi:hypothetical protein
MNRRTFALACLAAVGGRPAASATPSASPSLWSQVRRKLLRTHFAVLGIAGVVVGVGAWRHRSSADRVPPWEKD